MKVQGRSYLLLNDERAQVGIKLKYHLFAALHPSSLSDGPGVGEHTEPGVDTGSRTAHLSGGIMTETEEEGQKCRVGQD